MFPSVCFLNYFSTMKIIEREYSATQKEIISNLSNECDITLTSAKILFSRGYDTKEKIDRFFNPCKDNFYSPFLLKNMQQAVERIKCARDEMQTVVIFGDYDADGICATTLLYNALKDFGITAYTIIPERENGYGLTEEVLSEVLERVFPDLLITVDCGISNYLEVEYLNDLGVDVIVTDHHEIPSVLPNCPIINCKLEGQDYPFNGLCGAGVAYKLAYALIGERANAYLDLVALATVADSMPLIDENRDIVSEGIKLIKSGKGSKSILQLYESAGAKEVNSSSLAYYVAPRVNAAGRMGDAYSALKFFTESNFIERKNLANTLCEYNALRQVECEKVYQEVKDRLKEKPILKNSIVLFNEKWNSGILGIVSTRIVSEFNLPTILISKNKDLCHGSARSIDGLNIVNVLSLCSEHLQGYGGHSQAAGLTILQEDIESFSLKFDEAVSSLVQIENEKTIVIDEFINAPLSKRTALELSKFEPYGMCNQKPLFATYAGELNARPIKLGSPHLTFYNDGSEYIYFNGVESLQLLNDNVRKIIIFEQTLSYYNYKEFVKGQVKEVIQLPTFSEKLAFKSAFENFNLYKKDFSAIYSVKNLNEIQKIIDETSPYSSGTLFILCKEENQKYYTNLDKFEKVENGYFPKTNKTLLAYGFLGKLPSEYQKIVYLDNPLIAPLTSGEIIASNLNAFNFSQVILDRDFMGKTYKSIVSVCPLASGVYDLYLKLKEQYSLEQIAFSLAVFLELGFISFNGKFKVESGVKKPLNDSLIYTNAKK